MAVAPTARGQDALRFIAGYQAAHGGVSPSYREIARALGYRTKSPVSRLIQQLEERGHLRRRFGLARALELHAPVPFPRAPDGAPLYFQGVPA